jgi:hypothetical protein
MGVLFVIVLFVASSWMLRSLLHRLRRGRVGFWWWVAFAVLIVIGVILGECCAFYIEYHPGARYRVRGVPLPVVFFHLEESGWVDYPVHKLQALAAMLTNILTITALMTVPLWLALWRQHTR